MVKPFFVIILLLSLVISCQYNKKIPLEDKTKLTSDTLHITNKELEYEVIIIDGGFTNWFNTYARPRSTYTQEFLEMRNRFWVLEWNNRARSTRYLHLYEMPINYETNTNYGFEVNYMLYNYLVYFQITNKQQLGGYIARP